MATVHVEFQSAGLINQITKLQATYGRYKFDKARRAAHEQMSNLIQNRMAAELQFQVQETGRLQFDRPDHESGALLAAIMDEQNRRVTPSGFVVGLPDWLNRSPAKRYWRQIDQGAPERKLPGRAFFFDPGGPTPLRPELAGTQVRMPQMSRRASYYAKSSRAINLGPRPDSLLPQVVGPFPAYRWIEAGVRLAERMNYFAIYETHFAPYGIVLSKNFRK